MQKEIETTWADKTIFFLFCLMIVFTTLAYGTVHQPIIALFYIFAAVLVILWAYDAFVTKIFRFNKSLVQIPLLAAFVYGIFQIIPFGTIAETAGLSGIPRTISLEPFWTKVFSLHFLAFFFILAALLTYLNSQVRLKKIAIVITFFGFAYAFFAILQYVLSPDKIYGIYEVQFAQPFGSFVNRHNFAAYMEMTMAIPLGLLFVGAVQKDRRLIYITAVGLMGIALILSGSRGGLVALLAEVFFLIILTTKSNSKGQIALKIGLAVLLLTVIIFGSIFIGGESSLTRLAETAGSADFTTNRTHIWSVTLDIIKNHWLFGAGLGSFAAVYTTYDTFNGIERVGQAHNDYLQVLSDAGIVGLIIAGFFVFILFRTGFKNVNSKNKLRRGIAAGALAGCFAIFVHSIFDFVLHTTAIAYLFIILVSLVVVSEEKFSFENEEIQPKKRKVKSTGSVTPIETARKRIKK